MISYWISLILLFLNWGMALYIEEISTQNIFISAGFFALYFMMPLLNPLWIKILYYILPLFPALIFTNTPTSYFVWLIYLLLIIQASSVFKGFKLGIYFIYLYLLTILPYLYQQQWISAIYISLLAILSGILLFYLSKRSQENNQLTHEYETLNDEFRTTKRQLTSSEHIIRQEERNQIAREIHDSVGHRLTALLMQLEVARIQSAEPETEQKLANLKKLAQSSLDDTREAVKTLKSEETAGIQAVIQLIRKLEAESNIRLSITLHTGVLAVILTNQQSVVIYRSIQESLTNMMKHSAIREAQIEFQVVADHDFRFQVSHHAEGKIKINEGFGLTNMRERLHEISGNLTLQQKDGLFQVIGQFPIRKDANHGEHITR